MKTVLISLAVLAASTSLSTAADLMMDEAPVIVDEAMFDWTGLYAGVQVGVVAGTGKVDDLFNYSPESEGGGLNRYTSEPDLSGWVAGVHLGYLQQFNSFVLGAESDINWNTAAGEAPYFYHDNIIGEVFGPSDETAELNFVWDGSTRIKAGMAFDRLLAFATAGIAYGQANVVDHRIYNDGTEPHDFEGTANLLGWTAGVGLSYAVADNIVLTGEYRYTSFGEDSVVSTDDTDSNSTALVSANLHRLTAGVSFKF